MGHEAFLKVGPSVDPEDQHDTVFGFSFADLFRAFDSDASDAEIPHFHWGFHQDGEDAGDIFENFIFAESDFSFPFWDEDEDHQ